MRSSVGIMLSQTSGEQVMSHPDYEQNALHHGCLLVLLRGIGPSKPRTLQKVFERVRRINNVKVTDSVGNQRDIWIRYVHDYPVENSLWGDFQTHRKLLGLVTIGKFENQIELNELCRLHESLKVKYNDTLFDSRAIFFGPSFTNVEVDNNQIISPDPACSFKNLDDFTTPTNFKSTVFFYQENDTCNNLDKNISEFISSIFWILESKRLKRSSEKIDKAPLLLAPFEKKDFVGLDMESRTSRKRCIGRITKNLADLTLQAGLISDALNLYHAAGETLRAINDSLWLGAVEEGLCSASSTYLYPQIRQSDYFSRNYSLQEGSPQKFNAHAGRRRSSDITTKTRVLVENSVETNPEKIISTSIENSFASNSSSSSSVSSILTNSSATSSASSTVVGSNDKATNSSNLPGNILSPDEIITNYRKAIINYSKYRHAGIIETEAALKAARICIEQNRNLDVAMFLQNVLYINVTMTEADRVKRFEVLTELYQQIGYKRKAAFCQRLAAWKHVAQGNPNPDWSQSYKLMLDCFPGYLLSLDPLEVINNASGWPMLQIDLLQQLIMAAKRLGHSALATRHMTYLLQTQWQYMSTNEQKEMALQLQNLSAQCEGSPVALFLENGIVIPPANLTDIPYCSQFQVTNLAPYLRPHKIVTLKVDSGPFLFTPIHFAPIERRTNKKTENKISFYWVQNELSEVSVTMKNVLPFELVVSDMRLLSTGVVFESHPQTVTLQPDNPNQIKLCGTPIESGTLEIQGYSTHTLGVKSNCRLKHMQKRNFPSNFVIEVIPAMPKISIQTSLPKQINGIPSSDCVISTASLKIHNGEKTECVITLKNESPIPVEHIEIFLNSNIDNDSLKRIFIIDQDIVQSILPILPHSSVDIPIFVYGDADFFNSAFTRNMNSTATNNNGYVNYGAGSNVDTGPQSLNYSVLSSGHTSLPSRVNSPTHQIAGRKTEAMSSFRSTNSSNTAASAQNCFLSGSVADSRVIEAEIRIRYSGGAAQQEGYCRQCALSFNLELLPSVQLVGWDVLPAETPSQFYLVLDVSNLTNQEMSLNYSNNKCILIEAKESCRVPIPVDRCSLEEISEEKISAELKNDSCATGAIIIMPTQEEIVEKICSKHIADRVKLNWILTNSETKGEASLKGIKLSNTMIDLITVAPLHWTVLLNNLKIQPQSEFMCTAGQSISLHITVGNQSKAALKHLVLSVQFYQDYQNGVHNYHLETRVMMTGANQIIIPILNIDEKIQHECSVIFFTPGRFKANLQCRSLTILDESSLLNESTSNSLESNIKNRLKNHSNVCLESYAYALSNFNDISIDGRNQHIWKFIPAVEITVNECI